jgi:rfaE bifunctional protein kinase chain/domain
VKERLRKIVNRFSEVRLLVIGDFLVDQYVYGEISRVSREAPVLILKYQETSTFPGGAANTVANVASLGGKVYALGVIGDDLTADSLLSVWHKSVNKAYVVRHSAFPTTRKTRILAGSFHSFRQQVVRLDHETVIELSKEQETRQVSAIQELVPTVDAIIISDYSLGNVTDRITDATIQLGRETETPVIVDSRDRPGSFRGATTVTPNVTEVEAVLQRSAGKDLRTFEKLCFDALNSWQLDSLLVTRGKLGLALFDGDQATHIPPYGSDEVVDVTGAGDTVAATYSSALAAGATFQEAAELANYAGGIVVMKKGTATVSQTDLKSALSKTA